MAIETVVSPWKETYQANTDWPEWRQLLEYELHNQQSMCYPQIAYAIDYALREESFLPKAQYNENLCAEILNRVIGGMTNYPEQLNAAVVQAVETLCGVKNLHLQERIIEWL